MIRDTLELAIKKIQSFQIETLALLSQTTVFETELKENVPPNRILLVYSLTLRTVVNMAGVNLSVRSTTARGNKKN